MKIYQDIDGKPVMVAELRDHKFPQGPALLPYLEPDAEPAVIAEVVIKLRPGVDYLDWYERMFAGSGSG